MYNGQGHMTKMATPIYGKNLYKASSPEPVVYDLKLGMKHWGLKLYKAGINDDLRLTLTYFTAWSKLVTCEFEWEVCYKVIKWDKKFQITKLTEYLYLSHVVRKPALCICEYTALINFAATAKLISAFVFAIRIVQFLFNLNTKFQASSPFLWLYSLFGMKPGREPRRPVFSQRGSLKKHTFTTGGCLPLPGAIYMCMIIIFKQLFSKLLGQSRPNFMWSPLGKRERKFCEKCSCSHDQDSCHAHIYIYGKIFCRAQSPMILKHGMPHKRLKLYKV